MLGVVWYYNHTDNPLERTVQLNNLQGQRPLWQRCIGPRKTVTCSSRQRKILLKRTYYLDLGSIKASETPSCLTLLLLFWHLWSPMNRLKTGLKRLSRAVMSPLYSALALRKPHPKWWSLRKQGLPNYNIQSLLPKTNWMNNSPIRWT